MQFFEVLFLSVSTLLLILISFFGDRRKSLIRCFQIGLIPLILHVLFEIVRWQMAFCYFMFFLLALLLLKKSTSHLIFRILGFTTGSLLIATSCFYCIMMPIIELPAPVGAYQIGSTCYTIVDEQREEIQTDDPDDKRELFVEVWYPANLKDVEDRPAEKSLWQELHIGQLDRVSFFMNYLEGINTHAFTDVPPDTENGPFPLILFNHGFQMFTSQNTLLMEHLASHGYIVVSIAHPYESLRVNLSNGRTVMPEFIMSMEKFKEAMTWIERSSALINAAKDSIENIQNKKERVQVMLSAIENSEMNNVVIEWERDTRFILDQLIGSTGPKLPFKNCIDTSRIGVMGMSIGGAVAAEFAKADGRIKAGINMDGLQYGARNEEGLTVPFMMIYSEDGTGTNDFLGLNSTEDFHEITFLTTRHADFTDMNVIWPVMRMYGQLGDIPGDRMIQLTNDVVLNFWDHYLKSKPFRNFTKAACQELEVQIYLKDSQ